jgi:hypothetical protein
MAKFCPLRLLYNWLRFWDASVYHGLSDERFEGLFDLHEELSEVNQVL